MKQKTIVLIFFLVAITSAQFKFAHVTDTHVGSETGAEDLQRTVQDINQNSEIKFVLITGDISEFGADKQLRLAKQILDSLNKPWYVIPGNHDMKWSESAGTSFAKIFGYERFVFDYAGYKFLGLHQGPRLKMGDAYWTVGDIQWVDSILSNLANKRQRIIVATHYPADSGIANWYEMTRVLWKYNTQVMLNGHWHANVHNIFDGIESVVGRSNLRGKDSIGGYNIVEIKNDSMLYLVKIPGEKTENVWCAIPLGERNYAKLNNTIESKNIFENEFPFVTASKRTTSNSEMLGAPVITDDYIISAFFDGNINFESRDTKFKNKQFHHTAPIAAIPATEKNYLVFTSTDSNIYCLDIVKMKLVWKYKTNASIVAPPIIEKGIVYCGASDKVFRSINLQTGKLIWQYDSLQGHCESKPLIIEDKIIFGAWDEHLYCLNKKNGKLIWKWNGDKRGTLFSPAVCEPVYSYGKVFIVAPDRFMTAIDIETGKNVWRTNQFKVRETIGISEDKERIYIRTMNDSLYAISATADKPEIVWALNADFGYDINSSQIREKDGVMFCTTKNGIVIVVDGKSGKLLWKYKSGNVIANTPIPLSKQQIIFSNILGTIEMLQIK